MEIVLVALIPIVFLILLCICSYKTPTRITLYVEDGCSRAEIERAIHEYRMVYGSNAKIELRPMELTSGDQNAIDKFISTY
jgi:hypothetical protein